MTANDKNTVFLSGDEALAQGAYEAGLKVSASYPGTPATEITEYLAQFKEVDAQWSVNEKVAYEVALGAAVAGVRSIFAAKHVGLNVAMDPLMTSAYLGVNAGFVVVTCDDPGLHSSQNEQDNRLIAKFAKIPMIEPASPAEAYTFIKEAYEVSEKFDIPVLFRMTTRIAHTKENLEIGVRREVPKKDFKINNPKYVMVPSNAYKKHLELEQKFLALQEYSEQTELNKIEIKDKKIGFITSGVSYLYVKENYPEASVFKLGFSYPFPEKKLRKFVEEVQEVYVIEELEPFIEEELKILGLKIKAKHPSFRVGELRPEYLSQIVAGQAKVEIQNKVRKPVLCPGCSHRAVFSVLKKLKLTVTGDIGCYTLGALPPLSALHTCVCMGGSVTFLDGFVRAGEKNVVGVIGDSTFVHTGVAGLINLAYNKAKGVLIIMDNGTTAMTGSQPHPATGMTIKNEPTGKLSLEELCRACGAEAVDVIDPYQTKALAELIKKRQQENVLAVIIARFPCRLIDRSKKPAPEFLKEKCKTCNLCLAIDCPALKKDDNSQIMIDKNLCTGCNLCVEYCNFGALKKS